MTWRIRDGGDPSQVGAGVKRWPDQRAEDLPRRSSMNDKEPAAASASDNTLFDDGIESVALRWRSGKAGDEKKGRGTKVRAKVQARRVLERSTGDVAKDLRAATATLMER